MTLKAPKRRFVDNGPKVEILSMPDSGPIKSAEGGEETASALWTFHLPGEHDQSTHGHGGLHSETALRKTFDYHDETTGLTTRVTSIRGGDANRSTYVDIKVTDRDGNIVGGGTRTIHATASESVAHSGFALERGMQGQGFMTRYNQQVEQSYRGHGIKRIEIHASGGQAGGMQLVGGYAWAKAGYDFTPDSRAVVGQLATIIYTGGSSPYSRDIQAQIFRVARNPNASPIDYAMIGYRPGAKTWPGKQIMLNMSWDGVKTL